MTVVFFYSHYRNVLFMRLLLKISFKLYLSAIKEKMEIKDTYLTIEDISEGLYKEKMSKFISFAIPVNTVDEAKEYIEMYSKEYYDARHVCWAYMIGHERLNFRSNDNGEPSGTAGKPILGQINSYNLTNILIVVIRYFGGIKLGTSGLIVAYRDRSEERRVGKSVRPGVNLGVRRISKKKMLKVV